MPAAIETIASRTADNRIMREREIWEQQDLVDNAVHQLLNELLRREVEWDMHIIGDVRDSILETLEFHGLGCADELYPSAPEVEYEDEAKQSAWAQFFRELKAHPVQTIAEFFSLVLVVLLILYGFPIIAGLIGY